MNPRLFIKGLVLIATLAGVALLLEETDLGGLLDTRWVDDRIVGNGLAGEALFVAVGAVFTAFGFPRQAVAFLGGYAFGLIGGTALALGATALGCGVAFGYARLLGREFVAHRFPGKVKRADAFLSRNPFAMTLLVRLLPVGSNLLTNLTAGVSQVGAVPFLAGSALGYLPQTVVFALAGSGVQIAPVLRIGLSAVLFVVSASLGVYLYRRYRRGRGIDADIDRALDADGAPSGGAETDDAASRQAPAARR